MERKFDPLETKHFGTISIDFYHEIPERYNLYYKGNTDHAIITVFSGIFVDKKWQVLKILDQYDEIYSTIKNELIKKIARNETLKEFFRKYFGDIGKKEKAEIIENMAHSNILFKKLKKNRDFEFSFGFTLSPADTARITQKAKNMIVWVVMSERLVFRYIDYIE